MRKTIRRGIAFLSLMIAGVIVPGLRAQEQKVSLPAPLPAQIFTAKKVFLSNAGDETLGEFNGGPDRAYNQIYTALKSFGRYDLVTAPSDAELIFEVSIATRILGENVSGGGGQMVSNRTIKDPQLRLTIRDVKTHVLLWTYIEHVQAALLQGNRDKNFGERHKECGRQAHACNQWQVKMQLEGLRYRRAFARRILVGNSSPPPIFHKYCI